MEPLKVYAYLCLARRRVFDWVRPLDPRDTTREVLPGQRSLARILTHTMGAEWAYLRRIQGRPLPPCEQWPIREEEPPPFAPLERAWNTQAEEARRALEEVADWSTDLEYVVHDEGRSMVINASRGDIFTQLVLHEVHHRAQAMVILRQLGVALDDVDYNTLVYRRRPAPPA